MVTSVVQNSIVYERLQNISSLSNKMNESQMPPLSNTYLNTFKPKDNLTSFKCSIHRKV